jgi:hypothetical protein
MIGGLTIGLLALVYVLIRQLDVARINRMKRGAGVLATWTVPAEQWERFRASSREWDSMPKVGANRLDVAQDAGDAGIAVTVSDNALRVGDDFHSIEKNAHVRIYDGWMEFDMYVPRVGRMSDGHVIHRFPVAPGSEAAAQAVASHYERVYNQAAASPRIKIVLAIIFIGGPLLAALLAWWFQWK